MINKLIYTIIFKYYVSISQAEFSNQCYISTAKVADLVNKDICVGSRDSKRYWLDRISESLEEVRAETKDWIICYSYALTMRQRYLFLKTLVLH